MNKRAASFCTNALFVFFCLGLFSCATVKQTVDLTKLRDDVPISASKAIFHGGNVFASADTKIIKHFSFTKEWSARASRRNVELDINAELSAIIRETGADGITELQIRVVNIRAKGLPWVSVERYLGAALIPVGAVDAFVDVDTSEDLGDDSNDRKFRGYCLLGSGTALLIGSLVHAAYMPVKYLIEVEGNAVSLPK